ncbi:MAG: acyl-CoA dehydratase activase, partial [bacterium]
MILGLDAGSVSVKGAIVDGDGTIIKTWYLRHRGNPYRAAAEVVRTALQETGRLDFIAFTGSSGKVIAASLGLTHINEIVAQVVATRRLFPGVRTIIEMGGEDSKLILLDTSGIRDFSMNSVCAAGTGSFLDQQAERLRLSIEEFGTLALSSRTPPRVAGRCSVFAKSDMIHLQQIATPLEDIVAGLCFAVARNFKGSIVKGRDIAPPVSFQGGVAANPGMRRAFAEVLEIEHLVIPEHFACMGAIGAALKSLEDKTLSPLDIAAFQRGFKQTESSSSPHPPLMPENTNFLSRHHLGNSEVCRPSSGVDGTIPAYMGIDIGSISTNLAVIDSEGRLLAKRYLMTAGRPIEAVLRGLREIEGEIGEMVAVRGVGTTGSGRYMIADFVGADIVKNEITAQATAATFIDPRVDTIFEIGGQDSKYISLRGGVIVDFEMNKACAAGTGSFLEEQAEKLNIPIKEEFARAAFSSQRPC